MSLVACSITGCSLSGPQHRESLWRWYRTTTREAEIRHLDHLRSMTRDDDVDPGLRLERAFHERRVGEPARVQGLLEQEMASFPVAAGLITRLAEVWGVSLSLPVPTGAEPEPDEPVDGRSVLLMSPTVDATESAASQPPVPAFDAAAWDAANGYERYVVPMQIGIVVLRDVGWRWTEDAVGDLPWRDLVSDWGIGSVYVAAVHQWRQPAPTAIEYDVSAVLVVPDAAGAGRIVAEASLASMARSEVQQVLTGPLLADNPMGAENERIETREARDPVDENELAMGLQRGLVSRTLGR